MSLSDKGVSSQHRAASKVRNFALLLLATVYCLLSSGCGFTPLYGDHGVTAGGAASQLNEIFIGNIPDASGQYLRNALMDRFYETGRPVDAHYSLAFTPIGEGKTDLDITKNATATRAQLRLSTTFTLKDNKTDTVLLTRTITGITSYDVLLSEFTTRISEQNARQNALNDLARQIETQLALYFQRTPPK